VLADDHEEILTLLRIVWVPCSIDASRHHLAMLATAFDHYQQSGAPQVCPRMSHNLTP
jgi:hypothetical protein